MKKANFVTSSCRHCRYYQSEGRRGGMCQQLGVPVQSHWKACSLAARPFSPTWEHLEEVVRLENSLTLNCSSDSALVDFSNSDSNIEIKQPTAV
jgi:hypothetical protein